METTVNTDYVTRQELGQAEEYKNCWFGHSSATIKANMNERFMKQLLGVALW